MNGLLVLPRRMNSQETPTLELGIISTCMGAKVTGEQRTFFSKSFKEEKRAEKVSEHTDFRGDQSARQSKTVSFQVTLV